MLGEPAEVAARPRRIRAPARRRARLRRRPRVAARLSTLETPAALMAVCSRCPSAPALGELRGRGAPALVVYADRLADPGNLGTLVRAAAAFAAAALVASPGSVDLFSPKVVRAGMGAVFELPLYQDVALAAAVAELGARASTASWRTAAGRSPTSSTSTRRRRPVRSRARHSPRRGRVCLRRRGVGHALVAAVAPRRARGRAPSAPACPTKPWPASPTS